MDETEEDRELGVRVSVHLIGEAFEALGYEFWCHEVEGTRHECAAQKESKNGGKYTPRSFALDFINKDGNGFVRVFTTKRDNFDIKPKQVHKDFLLADPEVSIRVVKAILTK